MGWDDGWCGWGNLFDVSDRSYGDASIKKIKIARNGLPDLQFRGGEAAAKQVGRKGGWEVFFLSFFSFLLFWRVFFVLFEEKEGRDCSVCRMYV